MTRDALEISPRLGLDPGRIHLYLPAAERFAAYDYRVDEETRTIRLEFNCDGETDPGHKHSESLDAIAFRGPEPRISAAWRSELTAIRRLSA